MDQLLTLTPGIFFLTHFCQNEKWWLASQSVASPECKELKIHFLPVYKSHLLKDTGRSTQALGVSLLLGSALPLGQPAYIS